MKLKDKSVLTIVTDIALVVIFTALFAISFVPTSIIPINSGGKISAIYHGNKEKTQVSLMFNVYENNEVVKGIVDTLDIYGAKATFFMGGCFADDNGELLKYIVESGHEIGNHGYFHKEHKTLNYAQNKEEIYLTSVVIEALSGVKPTLFAPPSGSFCVATLDVCCDLNYKLIMWSKDTIDWRDKDTEIIYQRATKNISNGDLILMHPKVHTLKVLPRILDYYKKIGMTVVTVGENIKEI